MSLPTLLLCAERIILSTFINAKAYSLTAEQIRYMSCCKTNQAVNARFYSIKIFRKLFIKKKP